MRSAAGSARHRPSPPRSDRSSAWIAPRATDIDGAVARGPRWARALVDRVSRSGMRRPPSQRAARRRISDRSRPHLCRPALDARLRFAHDRGARLPHERGRADPPHQRLAWPPRLRPSASTRRCSPSTNPNTGLDPTGHDVAAADEPALPTGHGSRWRHHRRNGAGPARGGPAPGMGFGQARDSHCERYSASWRRPARPITRFWRICCASAPPRLVAPHTRPHHRHRARARLRCTRHISRAPSGGGPAHRRWRFPQGPAVASPLRQVELIGVREPVITAAAQPLHIADGREGHVVGAHCNFSAGDMSNTLLRVAAPFSGSTSNTQCQSGRASEATW